MGPITRRLVKEKVNSNDAYLNLPLVTARKQNTLNTRSILFLMRIVVVSVVGIITGARWRVLEIWG